MGFLSKKAKEPEEVKVEPVQSDYTDDEKMYEEETEEPEEVKKEAETKEEVKESAEVEEGKQELNILDVLQDHEIKLQKIMYHLRLM